MIRSRTEAGSRLPRLYAEPHRPGGSGTRPNFFTREMWFAWLLRSDVRGSANPEDAAAQRDFVAWWLLYGRQEYPRAWSCGPEQIALAMEDVGVPGGGRWPRLLWYLWRIAPSLQEEFPLSESDSRAAFFAWYRVHGLREFPAAPSLPADATAATERPIPLSTDHRPGPGPSLPWSAAALLGLSKVAVREMPEKERQDLAGWYVAGGWTNMPEARPRDLGVRSASAPAVSVGGGPALAGLMRPGVNLCGYVRGELGMGEDVRSMSASLAAAGIEHVILDAGRPGSARQQDSTALARVVGEPRHPVTIFCLSPFDAARLRLEQGPDLFSGTYRIGSWAWELPEVPEALCEIFDLVDEVWAHSRYSARAYERATRRNVRLMPPSVVLPAVESVKRTTFGIPNEAEYCFIYPFDPNSYLARKNPVAAIAAFKAAFLARDTTVALLLRANGQPGQDPRWLEVESAAAIDPRIRIVPGTLDRARALGLLANCDCMISPHRAEGFGRNIAEAVALGVPVIATGFSGCLDFLEDGELVRWRPRPIVRDDYPFGEGLWWAEPDIEHLASLMRTARAQGRRPRCKRWAERTARFAAAHSPEATGQRYAERIRQVLDSLGCLN